MLDPIVLGLALLVGVLATRWRAVVIGGAIAGSILAIFILGLRLAEGGAVSLLHFVVITGGFMVDALVIFGIKFAIYNVRRSKID